MVRTSTTVSWSHRAPRGGSANGGYFRIRSESQELRLNSPSGARWTMSAASMRDARARNAISCVAPMTWGTTAAAVAADHQQHHLFALQGQDVQRHLRGVRAGAYAVNDQVSILSGLRLSHERIGYRFDDLGNGVVYGAPACSRVSPTVPIETCHDDTALSGRIGVQGKVAPGVSVYATYSTGFKGRAYDLSSSLTTRALLTSGPYAGQPVADAIAAQQPVASETVANYEVGLRMISADRNFSWNLTAYRERFEGFQAQSRDTAVGLNVLNSIGSVRAEGVESEFSARLAERLTLAGAAAYSRAVMADFDNAACYFGQTAAQGCVGGRQDLTGKTLFNAPRWSLNVNAYYQQPLDAGSPARGQRRLSLALARLLQPAARSGLHRTGLRRAGRLGRPGRRRMARDGLRRQSAGPALLPHTRAGRAMEPHAALTDSRRWRPTGNPPATAVGIWAFASHWTTEDETAPIFFLRSRGAGASELIGHGADQAEEEPS